MMRKSRRRLWLPIVVVGIWITLGVVALSIGSPLVGVIAIVIGVAIAIFNFLAY